MSDHTDDKPATQLNTTRLLACVRCQRMKIRCDRTTPCANCVRRNIQCVPGTAVEPRQRRKRFPERELLDRIRRYEGLLRDNSVEFEPLHKDHTSSTSRYRQSKTPESDSDESDTASAGTKINHSTPTFGARNYWDVVIDSQLQTLGDYSDDSVVQTSMQRKIRDMWADAHENFGFLLPFGQPKVKIDLSACHPDQATIFKLWQIYLDNVNPLLKVTHTPTLQNRIVTAATNVSAASPVLTALMFAIYSVAINSLRELECVQTFGLTRQVMLTDYQLSCQHALANCAVLKTNDRECLTALYLFIFSVESNIDPYSISSLLGIAVRIAYRIGLPNEFTYAKLPPLEAELRRRLWWSLATFDSRIAEMSGQPATLNPTWDCAAPGNLSDFELQFDMQESPKPQSTTSEAIFVVVRSEMGDYLRHAPFIIDFVNPALNIIAQQHSKYASMKGDIMNVLEQTLEDRYLKHCNPENSVHFLTIWFTRMLLAKNRLLRHYSATARVPGSATDEQRDEAATHALMMLKCDTELMKSPLTKAFHWYLFLFFPFAAYFHILQDLRKRPLSAANAHAWETMSESYDYRFVVSNKNYNIMFKLFGRLTFSAWGACEAAYLAANIPYTVPRLVQQVTAELDSIAQAEAGVLPETGNLNLKEDSWVPFGGVQAGGATADMADFDMTSFGADLDANGQSFMGMIMDGIDWSGSSNWTSPSAPV